MAQRDILRLINRRKWTSRKDLLLKIDISSASMSKNIKQLVKYKDVFGLDVKVGKNNKFFLRKKRKSIIF